MLEKTSGLTRQVTVKNLPQIVSNEDLKNGINRHLFYTLLRDRHDASPTDLMRALALTLKDQMAASWIKTQRFYRQNDHRTVFYLSMEFYLGRMLQNAVTNLGLESIVNETVKELNINYPEIKACERDAGLGNGGLGRLAACFLDSMATLNIPCVGYGLRYQYGIFEQIINSSGEQVEKADQWLAQSGGYVWEVERMEDAVDVHFYGKVSSENGNKWVNTERVYAIPHDVPIPGYRNNVIGTLRLWKAKAGTELAFEHFSTGDYMSAVEMKNQTENITRVLYPDDRTDWGKELRLKQEYFLVAASIRDILNKHLKSAGLENFATSCFLDDDSLKEGIQSTLMKRQSLVNRSNSEIYKCLQKLSDKVSIQLNDTHPSLAIPELMRILLDEFMMEWDSAWQIVKKCFNYTNHTVLPEALERWSVSIMERLLPRHLQIIYQINYVFLSEVRVKMPNVNDEIISRMSLVEEGSDKKIKMANLSIIGSSKVNGVARVHTDLIKATLFKDFVEYYPEKDHFFNVTNGVTPRRWIAECNPELSKLISSKIGSNWIAKCTELKKLEPFKTNIDFLNKLIDVKRTKKQRFADYLFKKFRIRIQSDWFLTMQVKRIHEYKRQLLNILNVIILFNRAKRGELVKKRTIVIGGKAAPAYERAKKIINLINRVSKAIDEDSSASKCLKVVFLPNFDVSTAEIAIPAADLSVQISLAGMEASGTGNMKFMMNGALTIGTLDGANQEIFEAVGPENMFSFGMTIPEVPRCRAQYEKERKEIIENDEELEEALQMLETGYFRPDQPWHFKDLADDLRYHDHYMVIKDLHHYQEVEEEAVSLYYNNKNTSEWSSKALINIYSSGIFSSDESIKNYADNIWNVKYSREPLSMD